MDEELRWVSMGFDPAVMTCKKYDVNGYRFHTEEHQNSRLDPKTINTGVYTPGQNSVDYYGRVQNIYKIKFHQGRETKSACVQMSMVRSAGGGKTYAFHWFGRS